MLSFLASGKYLFSNYIVNLCMLLFYLFYWKIVDFIFDCLRCFYICSMVFNCFICLTCFLNYFVLCFFIVFFNEQCSKHFEIYFDVQVKILLYVSFLNWKERIDLFML